MAVGVYFQNLVKSFHILTQILLPLFVNPTALSRRYHNWGGLGKDWSIAARSWHFQRWICPRYGTTPQDHAFVVGWQAARSRLMMMTILMSKNGFNNGRTLCWRGACCLPWQLCSNKWQISKNWPIFVLFCESSSTCTCYQIMFWLFILWPSLIFYLNSLAFWNVS